jgi:hypothetical protein
MGRARVVYVSRLPARGARWAQTGGLDGFCHRATHNLGVLLDEAREIQTRLLDGTYVIWYEDHLDNSIYLPLIRQALEHRPCSEA